MFRRRKKPDYAEIDRLERLDFPEWFPPEKSAPELVARNAHQDVLDHKRNIERSAMMPRLDVNSLINHVETMPVSYSCASSCSADDMPSVSRHDVRLRPVKSSVVLPWDQAHRPATPSDLPQQRKEPG